MASPPPPLGLWHVALQVRDLAACEAFYTGLLGLRVEWRPDPDNVYLTSGRDNLALHRVADAPAERANQRLDHIGDRHLPFTHRNKVDRRILVQGLIAKSRIP